MGVGEIVLDEFVRLCGNTNDRYFSSHRATHTQIVILYLHSLWLWAETYYLCITTINRGKSY